MTDFIYTERRFREQKDVTECIKLRDRSIYIQCSTATKEDDEEFTATNSTTLKIEYKKKVDYRRAISDVEIIENFFNLIFLKPHYTDKVLVIKKYGTKKQLGVSQRVHFNRFFEFDRAHTNDYLLAWKLDEVSDITKAFQRWFDNYSEFSPIVHNLFTLKTFKTTEEDRFIMLISSLETLHRLFPEDKEKAAEYKKHTDTLRERCPEPELQEIINDKLKYGYQPTLQSRLNELHGFASDLDCPLLPEEQLKKLAITRNYYIHRDPDLRNKILSPVEIYEVNNYLYIYLKSLFLSLCLLNIADTKKIIKDSHTFNLGFRETYF
jgi:hypothetical protein